MDESDLVQIALLADLAALDALPEHDAQRASIIRSALELTEQLDQLGGGSLGEEKLAAVRRALEEEVGAPC